MYIFILVKHCWTFNIYNLSIVKKEKFFGAGQVPHVWYPSAILDVQTCFERFRFQREKNRRESGWVRGKKGNKFRPFKTHLND